MAMPGLGEVEVPMQVRLALALALSLLLLPLVEPLLPPSPDAPIGVFALIASETMVGLFLGSCARVVFLALPLAGQLLGLLIGLSNVLQFDPTLAGTGSALSRFLGLAGVLLLFALGLHALPLAALLASYRSFPAGNPLPAGELAATVTQSVATGFALALQLCAPFVLASVVLQAALGLISRLVPQIQVFFVAMPAQILGGILLLAFLVGPVFEAWQDALRASLTSLAGG
jgi:flagellar biosynthesis protein FliR